VERREKQPTLIESFHLPHKIDLSEAQSAMLYRGRAEFDRRGAGVHPAALGIRRGMGTHPPRWGLG